MRRARKKIFAYTIKRMDNPVEVPRFALRVPDALTVTKAKPQRPRK